MCDISLDAFDEIGNEIAAPPELNIDLRPGIARPVAQGHKPIVDPGDVEDCRASGENQGCHRGDRAWVGRLRVIVNDRMPRRSN